MLSENHLIGGNESGHFFMIDATISQSVQCIPLRPYLEPSFVPYSTSLHIISVEPLLLLASHPSFGCQVMMGDSCHINKTVCYAASFHLNRIRNATSVVVTSGIFIEYVYCRIIAYSDF